MNMNVCVGLFWVCMDFGNCCWMFRFNIKDLENLIIFISRKRKGSLVNKWDEEGERSWVVNTQTERQKARSFVRGPKAKSWRDPKLPSFLFLLYTTSSSCIPIPCDSISVPHCYHAHPRYASLLPFSLYKLSDLPSTFPLLIPAYKLFVCLFICCWGVGFLSHSLWWISNDKTMLRFNMGFFPMYSIFLKNWGFLVDLIFLISFL